MLVVLEDFCVIFHLVSCGVLNILIHNCSFGNSSNLDGVLIVV